MVLSSQGQMGTWKNFQSDLTAAFQYLKEPTRQQIHDMGTAAAGKFPQEMAKLSLKVGCASINLQGFETIKCDSQAVL